MDFEKAIRDEFTGLFESNKAIEAVYKQIRRGVATYEDAHKFSLEVGRILRRSFDAAAVQVPDGADLGEIADAVVGALEQNGKLTSLVCETIQDELNSMAGIGVNAVNPGVKAERLAAVREAVTNADDIVAAKSAIDGELVTYAQRVVDDWVRSNATFQRNLGLEPVLARKWSGRYGSHDTKHTDWCKDLEGVWKYGDQPENVFARHTGCSCTVMYYPNGSVKGKITALAKGEKDTDKVLWNTGEVFSNSRNAELRRRRQMYGKEEARKILNEEWRGGRNGQAERHFT